MLNLCKLLKPDPLKIEFSSLSNRYGPLGRLQIHQIQCVMNHYFLLGTLLSSRVKRRVAEVLLAASYFLNISWKSKALEAVKAITADEPADYLQIWSNLRECTLAGLEIGNEIKESAIQSVGHGRIDTRSNALYGQLILSYASNKIRWNNLDHARSMLDHFSPLNSDSPSTMERLVLKKKEVTIGRIDRYQGKFRLAREHLTPLSDVDAKLDGVTGRDRISQLACVLCELGEPRKAQMLLCEEIKIMEKLGSQDISSGRCLRLSLAEALLQQGSLKEAEDIYLRLKEVVEDFPNPNFTIGIEKLRLWMGLARISHLKHSWSDALIKWEKALGAAEDCNWRAGFIEMVVRYSISDVKSKLGERENSESHSKKADELYRHEGRQFWLTGLGTYWLDFVWRSLGHKPETL